MLLSWIRYLTPVLCVYLICLNFYIYDVASEMQGDARVVNYAGLVRGATQRLIKLELNGIQGDELISSLDAYAEGLGGTRNYLNIPYMKDAQFQSNLTSLSALWSEVKAGIYDYRRQVIDKEQLLLLSERHFTLANETVFYAEIYSDKKMAMLEQTKQMFWLATTLFVASLCYQIFVRLRLQKTNERLGYLAYADPKTGLPNRTRCLQLLDYYRSGDLPKDLVCIMFDLNNLKRINDRYGHECGDQVLRAFALLLGQLSIKYGFIGRYGGDEFLAVFERCSQEDKIRFIADLTKRVVEYNRQADVQPIFFAYGISMSNEDGGNTVDSLLSLADMRMYANKRKMKEK